MRMNRIAFALFALISTSAQAVDRSSIIDMYLVDSHYRLGRASGCLSFHEAMAVAKQFRGDGFYTIIRSAHPGECETIRSQVP